MVNLLLINLLWTLWIIIVFNKMDKKEVEEGEREEIWMEEFQREIVILYYFFK